MVEEVEEEEEEEEEEEKVVMRAPWLWHHPLRLAHLCMTCWGSWARWRH